MSYAHSVMNRSEALHAITHRFRFTSSRPYIISEEQIHMKFFLSLSFFRIFIDVFAPFCTVLSFIISSQCDKMRSGVEMIESL